MSENTNPQIKELLEDCLVASVLTLSQQLEFEDKQNLQPGQKKIGGDYLRQAVTQIKGHKPAILCLLLQNPPT